MTLSKFTIYLARFSGVIGFGVALTGLYYRYHFSSEFKHLPFHQKGIDLLKNYEPAIEKLGDKDQLVFKKAEITDKFNFNNGKEGRVKIPVEGPLRKADLLVYAKRNQIDKEWWIEKLEIYYTGSGIKYKFYDGEYNRPKDLIENDLSGLEFVAEKK